MIGKIFYEFWPHERRIDTTYIIEAPKLDNLSGGERKEFLVDFLNSFGVYYHDYENYVQHPTLESASARERGCQYSLKDGCFEYQEVDSGNYMRYRTLPEYMRRARALSNYDGELSSKMIIVPIEKTIARLKLKGIDYKAKLEAVRPPGFDGCVCRECNGPKYMAEPDGEINDGMLTCYLCKEKLKIYNMWPYSKEEIERREKEALKNV